MSIYTSNGKTDHAHADLGRALNSKERVHIAFRHEEPDRVPVSELYINSPVASEVLGREAWTGWGGYVRAEIFTKMLIEGRADEFFAREARDTVDIYRELDLDTVMIERPPLKHPIIPKVLEENVWKYEDLATGMWNIVKYSPETDLYHEMDSNMAQVGIAEFERLVELFENDPIDMDRWNWSQAEYIVNTCGHDKFLTAVVEIDFPPMSFVSWGTLFMECMLERPDLVERYLDYRVRKGLKFVDKYAAMGVDAVFDGEDLAGTNGPLFSPAMYRKFYMPRFQEIIKACHKHGMYYIRHTDGNIMSFADAFLGETGIDAYHSIDPGAGMDISLIKREYGDRVVLWGNVDCGPLMTYGTPEEVSRATIQCMKAASRGGGHVLTTSNTIHSDIPTKNYLAMLETARKFGQYPLNLEDCKS